MGKWLRGFGQNSNNNLAHPDERQQQTPNPHSEFPSPPRNSMPPASAAAAYHQTSMAQYGSPPTTIAMDIDNPAPSPRPKYSHQSNYHPQSSAAGKAYERARDDGAGRSRRSTSEDRRTRAQPPQGYRSNGATNPPPMQQPFPAQQTPPPMAYKNAPLGSSTPPDAVQPSFPPPAVTAESPPSSEAAQRRPAYLLHRDLVIGKGSYGQVCIASRGEPEGHSSGRSGKRKKFACKCVMLRNDPKYIAKLQEEVNVLRELRGHDNVIRLYDVFCVDNELFIITELGRGGDLFHLLTTHPKHGVTEAYAGT